ncbi:MAG: DUF3267 domain-containing protein [Bacteroidales bacterium]
MKRPPPPDELEEISGFEKVLTLSYTEISPFVISQLKRFSLPMALIWITVAISLFLSVWFWPGLKYPTDDPQVIRGLTAGLLLIPLLMIPVHEGLHLIPFRLAGARDIRVGADLRQGIFYVTAHRFVAGRRLFTMVALTPFLTVTAGIIVAMAFSPLWWKWVLAMSLTVHATMCAGDAALLGFMSGFRNREVFTWDDADRKEAYFYVSKSMENDK